MDKGIINFNTISLTVTWSDQLEMFGLVRP